MSLSFLHSFQSKLYEILKNNEIIKGMISSVYLSVQQDAKQPFILINILKITNIVTLAIKYYEVDFEICVFDHQKNKNSLIMVAGAISDCITPYSLANSGYSVVSSNFLMSEIVKGQDLLTTKLIIHYKALIKID